MLKVTGISKKYKDASKNAIEDINLTIEDGDIYGFIGPNGAGKSTTIKCIVGIHSFDSGEILLDDISLKNDPLKFKSMISYVADNPELYDFLTGFEYIKFICNVYKTKITKEEIIEKYANKFGMASHLDEAIKSYSHGMKQKIAIIASLAHNPKLLILDEPFVGLDPKAAYDLKEIIKELCNEGLSVFFSSHVLEVVEKFCNKIAIIKDGHIIASGLTEDIKGESSLEEIFLDLYNE